MNRNFYKIMSVVVILFFSYTKFQTVNASSELSISSEVMEGDYATEAYAYEIKQQDILKFLESVARHHDVDEGEFEYSSIPEVSMDRYSYFSESSNDSVQVSQVENSLAYGYTRNNGYMFYDIQNVIKENNLDITTDDDLGFATKDEIQQEVENLIHSLGIELEYAINIQSVTAEEVNNLLDEYFNLEANNIEISRFVTDLYMVSVNFSIDGIPINSFAMGDYEAGVVAEDTVFQLTFTENGLENADLRGYNAVGEKQKEINLDSQEIISLIENKYANIIILNETQLTSLELVNLHLLGSKTSEESELYIPVWLGIIEQEVDGVTYPTYVFIDAETKKELTLF